MTKKNNNKKIYNPQKEINKKIRCLPPPAKIVYKKLLELREFELLGGTIECSTLSEICYYIAYDKPAFLLEMLKLLEKRQLLNFILKNNKIFVDLILF